MNKLIIDFRISLELSEMVVGYNFIIEQALGSGGKDAIAKVKVIKIGNITWDEITLLQ